MYICMGRGGEEGDSVRVAYGVRATFSAMYSNRGTLGHAESIVMESGYWSLGIVD